MPFPTYQINIYDSLVNLLDILPVNETFSMKYEKKLNEIGTFALTVINDGKYDDIFSIDNIISILRADPDGVLQIEDSFFIRYTETVEADDGERLVLGGYSLLHLMKRRIIDPEDDSVQPNGGYATKQGTAGDVIRAYCREQMGDLASIDRQFPILDIPIPNYQGGNVVGDYRYESLYSKMRELGISGGVDFSIDIDPDAGILELNIGTIGTDRSKKTNINPPYVLLDPKLGNILNPRMITDAKEEITVIYALSEGTGSNRTLIKRISALATDSPFNRIEKKIDVRNSEKGNFKTVADEATKAILADDRIESIEFDISPSLYGAIYREDFFFGDVVTAQWRNRIFNIRIISIVVTVDDSGEKIEISVGDPNVAK